MGCVHEHDSTLFLARWNVFFTKMGDEVLSDKLQVVFTWVETDHWHLSTPLLDEFLLFSRKILEIFWHVSFFHIVLDKNAS